MTSSTSTESRTAVAAVTCLGCGCACDDIEVITAGGRIEEARHACALGIAWFGDGAVPDRIRVEGAEASLEQALAAGAALLAGASRPLVYLAPDISCEVQRAATGIADRLRARIDSISSRAQASILAAQERGRAGATLGEVRNRADVLVFWGVDPSLRYPRYPARYAPEPAGLQVPEGRRSRLVIAVDIGSARGPGDADVRVVLDPADEVATLAALAAMVGGADAANPVVDDLGRRLLAGRYAVIVADGEPAEQGSDLVDSGRAAALIQLTQALNGPTRAALSTLRGGGNRSGADACLTAHTGYPIAVDFARGFPRYRPFDGGAAAVLSRGEADAVLVIGTVALLPADVRAALGRVRSVVIGPRASDTASAAVAIDTGVAGIHEAGTALRMDDVPLPLRPTVAGPVTAADVIAALRDTLDS